MRLSTRYFTALLILLISPGAIILAAPAAITELASLASEAISDTTTGVANFNSRGGDLTLRSEEGNPENGETWRPEPKVVFLSCKPQGEAKMCTMSFARKSGEESSVLVAYDHECKRLGDWVVQRSEMTTMVNGNKHGHDFVTPNLPWNILVFMNAGWDPSAWGNQDLRIAYSGYVSFPFYWRDYPEKWRQSSRANSELWPDKYYDFFRIPFDCN